MEPYVPWKAVRAISAIIRKKKSSVKKIEETKVSKKAKILK